MRVSIIRGAPREFLTSLEIDPRWFDFSRNVPKNEHIVLPTSVPQPVYWPPNAAEDSAVADRVTLRWRRFGLGPNDRRMWGLEIIEEPVEWGVLLNVAYTCRTHANMALALEVRDQFERALCPDDGHARRAYAIPPPAESSARSPSEASAGTLPPDGPSQHSRKGK